MNGHVKIFLKISFSFPKKLLVILLMGAANHGSIETSQVLASCDVWLHQTILFIMKMGYLASEASFADVVERKQLFLGFS